MVKTLNLSAEIPASRELHIVLPSDIPLGPAEILLVVSSTEELGPKGLDPNSTLGALVASPYFGMWSDQEDITDSIEFACGLRSQSWKRPA